MNTETSSDLYALTAEIVSSHVSNNRVSVSDLPSLILNVHTALARLGDPVVEAETAQAPAVSIRTSIKNDYIVCLEDGKKLKMLKRHLMTCYQMTPDQYRAKWKLPGDYPMVAPAYAAVRKELAFKIGLGLKRVARAPSDGVGKEAPAKAPRKVRMPKASTGVD